MLTDPVFAVLEEFTRKTDNRVGKPKLSIKNPYKGGIEKERKGVDLE